MDRERTCIGCRKVAKKGDMLRIARTADGALCIDASGKGPGRGAYVCSDACLDAALGNGSLGRALRCRISADASERLRSEAEASGACFAAKGSEG